MHPCQKPAQLSRVIQGGSSNKVTTRTLCAHTWRQEAVRAAMPCTVPSVLKYSLQIQISLATEVKCPVRCKGGGSSHLRGSAPCLVPVETLPPRQGITPTCLSCHPSLGCYSFPSVFLQTIATVGVKDSVQN